MSAPAGDAPLSAKARESLAGAEAELAAGRYNNCANRCYYACFQAAIVALDRAGIRPIGRNAQWAHAFVLARFDGDLINRRKSLPSSLRGQLPLAYTLRQLADYNEKGVTAVQASRAVGNCRAFLIAVLGPGVLL